MRAWVQCLAWAGIAGHRRSRPCRRAGPVKPFVFTGIPRPGREPPRRAVRQGREPIWRASSACRCATSREELPGGGHRLHQRQVQLAWFGGFTGVQAPRPCRAPGHRPGRGGRDLQDHSSPTPRRVSRSSRFPQGHRRQDLHLRFAGLDLGRLMPEYFIRQAFPGKTPEQCSSASVLGRPQPTNPARPVRRLRGGAVDYSVWTSIRRPASRSEGRVRDLKARPSRNTSDGARATWTRPTGRLHGKAEGRAHRHHRSGHPRALRRTKFIR